MPYCFWRSSVKFQGQFLPKLGVSRLKNRQFESSLSKITRPVAAIKSLRFALFLSTLDVQLHEIHEICMLLNYHFWSWSSIFLAATKQLYEWFSPSVRLSVRPWSKYAVQLASWQLRSNSPKTSVCLSHLFDYVPIIISSWNFQELLSVTKVTSMQKVMVRGQRSRSRRSQPNLTVSGL